MDWPDGHEVCVCLTFDVDADVGIAQRGLAERLTSLSEARYGAVRGVPRILDMLRRRALRATFYVPGEIAQLHPELVQRIAAEGHEIGHHGHVHLFTDQATPTEQRDELERGLAALGALGIEPRGFRSPGWELTPNTLALLVEHGFRWDSSCMGDDRPYVERHGELELLELPVHWSLDDWAFFAFDRARGGPVLPPDALLQTWSLEFESALLERRMVTYTMHPEGIGRGYRMRILERLLDEIGERASVWFATHADVAQLEGAA